MPRYGDDLRAIVGIDKIKQEIKELADKIQILSTRSVSYQNQDGSIGNESGAGGSAGGVAAPAGARGPGGIGADSAAAGATEGLSQALNGSNGNPKGSEDGNLSLEDILDNNADAAVAAALDAIDEFTPALSSIDGWTDPDTGKAGVVRLDNLGAVPPDDWSDARTPPTDNTWQAGKYWLFGNVFFGNSWGELLADANAKGFVILANTATTAPDFYYQNSEAPSVGDTLVAYSVENQVNNGAPSYAGFTYITSGTSGYGPAGTCPAPTGYSCVLSAPTQVAFTPSGRFQVYQDPITGLWVGSEYDTEVPPLYAANAGIVYMRLAGSSREAVLRLGVNGTRLLYEVTPGSTSPLTADSLVRVYNARGQRIDVILGDEIGLYLVPS